MTKEEYEGERADAMYENKKISEMMFKDLSRVIYKSKPNFYFIDNCKTVEEYNSMCKLPLAEDDFNFCKALVSNSIYL